MNKPAYFQCNQCPRTKVTDTNHVRLDGIPKCPKCLQAMRKITKKEYLIDTHDKGLKAGEACSRTQANEYVVFQGDDANPNGTVYVRFIDHKGVELLRLDVNQWQQTEQDAVKVMGIIMSALQNGVR